MDQETLISPFQDCSIWEKGSYMPCFTSVLHWPLFKGNYAIERSNIVSFWKYYSLQITLNDDPICKIDGFRTMVNALLACSHCIIGRFSLKPKYKILIKLLIYIIFILPIYNHVLIILAICHAPHVPHSCSSLTMIHKTMNHHFMLISFH